MKINEKTTIYSFEDAMEAAKKNTQNKSCTKGIRLFLGNGFSQAYYGKFSYTTLYEAVKNEKKNKNINKLFNHFGTSNFEAVLSFLKHAQFLFETYKIKSTEIVEDYNRVRDALAEAILKVHPEKTTVIPEKNKMNCYNFLKQFDDIYTVNYDLLLYWTLLTNPQLEFSDYFFKDGDTPEGYCEYFEDGSKKEKKVFFLHGGLHLFIKNGKTLKKVWGNEMPLIGQIKREIENGYYPWVVAEGNHESKLQQIKSNPYLDHAFGKFSRQQGQLFTFGFSFSEQDTHIINAIVKNCAIRYMWIGVRGKLSDPKNAQLLEASNRIIFERKKLVKNVIKPARGPLEINFFDAGNMDIWGLNKER